MTIDQVPDGILRESLYVATAAGYQYNSIHFIAGYGYRYWSQARDKKDSLASMITCREMQTYCSRWVRPQDIHTYNDMLRTGPISVWNVCKQCLNRVPDRTLDFNDVQIYGLFESIGSIILFDIQLPSGDLVIDGLLRAVFLRQI